MVLKAFAAVTSGLLLFSVALNVWLYVQSETVQAPKVPTESSETSAQTSTGSSVVAKVNDRSITNEQWIQALKQRHGSMVLQELVNRNVVFAKAQTLDLEVGAAELEKEMSQMKAMQASGDHQMNVSDEEWRKEMRYYLLLEKIATQDIHIEQTRLREYYDEQRERFAASESVHLHQIVVDTQEQAEQVLTELKGGSDFSTLAKERSTDLLSSENGGDFGWVNLDDRYMNSDVLNAAAETDKGAFSDPIPLERGYAVIMVSDKKEIPERTFAEVQDQLRRELALQQIQSLDRVLERLKENMTIESRVDVSLQ